MFKKKSHRKGQVWTLDFLIGIFLFIIMLVLTIKLSLNLYVSDDYTILKKDAMQLSDNLLSTGEPENWNAAMVLTPGIADNNRINITRLQMLNNISYERTKELFRISGEYIFFFQNTTAIINTTDCVYGYHVNLDNACNPILSGIGYANLVKVDRLVIYNNTIIKMTVYVWK